MTDLPADTYVPGETRAPVILAMGKGPMALEIMARGRKVGLAPVQIPLLARALYFTGEIGAEINEQLFAAVAAHRLVPESEAESRDALAARRRTLPWVRLEKNYVFASPAGPAPLAAATLGRAASSAAIVVVVVCDASRLLGGCGGALFFMSGMAAEEDAAVDMV